jgi:hypothetical protein
MERFSSELLFSSGFIMWTRKLLEEYATIFRKQVYSKDVDPKVVQDAIDITHNQSRKVCIEARFAISGLKRK